LNYASKAVSIGTPFIGSKPVLYAGKAAMGILSVAGHGGSETSVSSGQYQNRISPYYQPRIHDPLHEFQPNVVPLDQADVEELQYGYQTNIYGDKPHDIPDQSDGYSAYGEFTYVESSVTNEQGEQEFACMGSFVTTAPDQEQTRDTGQQASSQQHL
jgi:hypothetical protein